MTSPRSNLEAQELLLTDNQKDSLVHRTPASASGCLCRSRGTVFPIQIYAGADESFIGQPVKRTSDRVEVSGVGFA